MKERIVVAKFGGTSVADAGQVRKISDIVRSDPARRFIVVSAPGKRFSDDIKVTDLLLDLYEKANPGPYARPVPPRGDDRRVDRLVVAEQIAYRLAPARQNQADKREKRRQ